MPVNEDPTLEHEADMMSDKALQHKVVQRKEDTKPNNTGLPDNLKAGIEQLSGMDMENVKVHYNSKKPARLSAHAYTKGTEIHVGPGQEKYLPHEMWHVVQQMRGGKTVTSSGNKGVYQLGRKIRERFKHLDEYSDVALKRRAARHSMISKRRTGRYTKRNKFSATVQANGLKVSFQLESAGMGGLHPRFEDRSASHTEPIWQALCTKHPDLLMERVNMKLRRRGKEEITDPSQMKCLSLISTNSPCHSSPRDLDEGCGGIEDSSMGADSDTEMAYVRDYTESAPSEYRSLRNAGAVEDKDADSSDEEMDTDEVRGLDLEDEANVRRMFK